MKKFKITGNEPITQMSIRQKFAIEIMKAMLSGHLDSLYTNQLAAAAAVKLADALIDKLNGEK